MAVNDLFSDYRIMSDKLPKADEDVVLLSRVRLARNFSQIPFPNRADMQQLKCVQKMAGSVVADIEASSGQHFDCVEMEGLTDLQRSILQEKQLISNNFLKNSQYRSLFVSQDRCSSIMVNEEDHIRIQCNTPGFDLQGAYEMASKIDDGIESKLNIAFDEKYGYLTSCLTNLGTGLRASVILHLPGLVYTRNINGIINISPQLGLAVKGMYLKGTEVVGNVFIVSNQLSLGFSEEELLANLSGTVKEIISREHSARKALQLYNKDKLEDTVWRAYGTLKYAKMLGDIEALELISKVRLGADMGILPKADVKKLNFLLTATRANYLRYAAGSENMSQNEIDRKRAEVVSGILKG